ncbi:APC family permease [Alicyclobacillus shizuokensis]|uniref:APC family permease n=1 Tax=Alicyclobacillus shizuokensis TaxID=392014 RepID=UPI00082950FC|nr:amino acid permease [Alicyclobacillus shizuokensis]MCL6625703.1 amino acid permease [Alicyclobacillus shizuokensis]
MSSTMKNSISVWQGIALYVGAVIGSGILILPGMTAGIAGANALFSWGGMIVLSIPLAYTFAFLAREYPSAGGVSTFVEKAFGRHAGALIGWFYFIAASAGQFIVPLTGGVYVTYAFHLPSLVAFLIAAVVLLGAVIGNFLGLRTSGKVQLSTSGLIVVVLLATIVLAIPSMHASAFSTHASGSALQSIGRAAMLIFWSFFGWEAIASLAPEFHHSERDVTRATWGAVVIVGVLYFGIALAVIGTHSYATGHQSMAQAMNNASLAEVLANTIGGSGAVVTAVLALVICLGTTNAFVASISRLAYSLSHEGLAPAWFDHVNEQRSTPQRAVLLVGALAGVGLVVTYVFNLSMSQLVYIPNSLGIATYILGTAAGVRLLRAWIGKVCAGVACALCLIAYPFVGTFIQIPLVVAALCIGYLLWRTRQERRKHRTGRTEAV